MLSYFTQIKKRDLTSQPHDQILLSNLWVCNARIHEADGPEVKLRRLAHAGTITAYYSKLCAYGLRAAWYSFMKKKQEKLSQDLGNPPVTRVMEAESVPALIPSLLL